jgi:transcriptional regulator with XRE-family HTH domain
MYNIQHGDKMKSNGFGPLLRDEREKGGISLRGLAKETGLDSAYLSRVERELNPAPRSEVIHKISESLCYLQKLDTADCEKLKRTLLDSAEQLTDHTDLIIDLKHRFADRLRAEGMTEPYIINAIKKVSLNAMEKVLSGEEQLTIASAKSYSPQAIEDIQSLGEEVQMLKMDYEESEPSNQIDSASDYINRNLNKFKPSSPRTSPSPRGMSQTPKKSTFRAGARAFIEVDGDLTSAQEEQLRSITTLVRSILKEK